MSSNCLKLCKSHGHSVSDFFPSTTTLVLAQFYLDTKFVGSYTAFYFLCCFWVLNPAKVPSAPPRNELNGVRYEKSL